MFATMSETNVKLRNLRSSQAASTGPSVASKLHCHDLQRAHARKTPALEKATPRTLDRRAR
jgi:hypothetical protein